MLTPYEVHERITTKYLTSSLLQSISPRIRNNRIGTSGSFFGGQLRLWTKKPSTASAALNPSYQSIQQTLLKVAQGWRRSSGSGLA